MTSKPKLDRVAYSPGEAAELLGVSRIHIYKMMDEGVLRSFNLGAARRIPVSAIDELVSADRVAESRIAQGLPARVEDPTTLARVGALLQGGGDVKTA